MIILNPYRFASTGTDFTDGLVAAWQFENDFLDYTANNHDATATGTVTNNTSGKVGNAADFQGSTDYLTVPDHDDFSFLDGSGDLPFSICFWFKLDTINPSSEGEWFINKRDGASTPREWQVSYRNGVLKLTIIEDSVLNLLEISYTVTLSTSTWYHLVVTYDGSETHAGISMYLDKVSVGTTSETGTYTGMTNTSSSVVIGAPGWSPTFSDIDGKMDEIKIYKNRELTSAEVEEMYDSESVGTSVLP